jgi:hypothetical protein
LDAGKAVPASSDVVMRGVIRRPENRLLHHRSDTELLIGTWFNLTLTTALRLSCHLRFIADCADHEGKRLAKALSGSSAETRYQRKYAFCLE